MISEKVSVILRLCALVFAVSSNVIADSVSGPNTEEYTYTVVVRQRQCSPYYWRECSYGWWFWVSCYTHRSENCQDVYVTETRKDRRCKAGWTGPNCNTAICTPTCANGQVCKAPPSTCECLGSGAGACSYLACSSARNCYPGTCAGGSTCICFPGFSGPNCDTVEIKPHVKDCSVLVYSGSPETSTRSDCTADNIPAATQWLSTSSPSRIQVRWRTEFSPLGLPRVNYVQNSPVNVGVAQAHFTVSMDGRNSGNKDCVSGSYSSPLSFKDCNVDVPWTNLGFGSHVAHGAQINVTLLSTSGAEKRGDNAFPGGNFAPTNIAGKTSQLFASYRVDLEPPTHCLLGSNNQACTCFPVYMDRDIRTDPVINPLMCEWTDAMSGLARYHVAVYFMQPGGDGTLEETRSPVHTEVIVPPHNTFHYTCVQSGVYSIQLTVYDRANNSARARKLFNYDGGSKWTVDDSVKVRIAEADPSTNYTWINNLPGPQSGFHRLTVVWHGRYKTHARYQDAWLKAAKPWRTPEGTTCSASNKCIDDIYPGRFGLRTINQIVNTSSILGYTVTHQTDRQGGFRLEEVPAQNSTPISDEQTTVQIPASSFQNGDTVVVWFTAQDMAGNLEKHRLTVGYDQSKPEVAKDKFDAKIDDTSKSGLFISVRDQQSGIKEIQVTIYDRKLEQTIFTGSGKAISVSKQHTEAERADGSGHIEKRAVEKQCPPEGDETCYCIPTGQCFAVEQYVKIDNCKFDYYTKDPLEFQYTVVNQAGLSISGTIRPTPEQLSEVRCREFIGYGLVAILIAVAVPCVALIAMAVFMLWRWRKYNDPLPTRLRTVYNRTFRHHIDREASNPVYVTAGYSKSAPDNEYGAASKSNLKNNNLKQNVDDEEYGTATDVSGLRVNARQVQADRTLAEGKFAVVKSGTVTVNNECLPVALKVLKRGFSAADRTLMDQKISFLSGISSHINIVKFIASYDGGVEGPAMLLELCDVTLKDWLTQNKITVDTLEEILNLVLDIARGMEHLHSKHVLHRRLAVRNVLLKRQTNGLVAKLIGFGPSAEDMDGGSGKEEVSRPVRWLAPETLNTMKSKNPTYNNKTDSWSFGITVWEMYSKGEKPYPESETKEVKGLLQRGHRMSCPKDCPPELFQSVVAPCWDAAPERRPEFNSICSSISSFRSGCPQEDYYTPGQTESSYLAVQQELYDDAK